MDSIKPLTDPAAWTRGALIEKDAAAEVSERSAGGLSVGGSRRGRGFHHDSGLYLRGDRVIQ